MPTFVTGAFTSNRSECNWQPEIFKNEPSPLFPITNRASIFAYVKAYAILLEENMTTLTASEARANLYKLIDDISQSHAPVQIKGKRSGAVLIAEDDWRAIQETLHLLSVPGMRESLRKGLKTPLGKCSTDPGW